MGSRTAALLRQITWEAFWAALLSWKGGVSLMAGGITALAAYYEALPPVAIAGFAAAILVFTFLLFVGVAYYSETLSAERKERIVMFVAGILITAGIWLLIWREYARQETTLTPDEITAVRELVGKGKLDTLATQVTRLNQKNDELTKATQASKRIEDALLSRQRLDRLAPLLRDGGMFALKPRIDLDSVQSDLMEWESSTRNPDIGWMFEGASPRQVRNEALKRAGIDPTVNAVDDQERERRYRIEFQGVRSHLLQVQAELQEASKFPDPKARN